MFSSSQITLVNPQPPIELVSSKKSVLNTVLYRDGYPYVSISTLDRAVSCTHITDLRTNQLLFTIQRRTFGSNTITFHQRYDVQKLKIDEWLKEVKSDTPHMVGEWSVSTMAGNFRWRRDLVLRLALYPENDADHPIAWIRPETHTETVALNITRGAEGSMDEIIVTFVVLEQQLRMKEKEKATYTSYTG